MNDLKTQYWSDKLGFTVKPKEDLETVPTDGILSNPLVYQYLQDKQAK